MSHNLFDSITSLPNLYWTSSTLLNTSLAFFDHPWAICWCFYESHDLAAEWQWQASTESIILCVKFRFYGVCIILYLIIDTKICLSFYFSITHSWWALLQDLTITYCPCYSNVVFSYKFLCLHCFLAPALVPYEHDETILYLKKYLIEWQLSFTVSLCRGTFGNLTRFCQSHHSYLYTCQPVKGSKLKIRCMVCSKI